MPKLALSADLLKDFSKLEKRARSRVAELSSMFQSQTIEQLSAQKGVDLKTHTGQRDPRARTVRIDDNHRGVLFADGDTYILYKILPHNGSDAWMARNEFRANVQTGAIEIRDAEAIGSILDEAVAATPAAEVLLYEHRKDKDFRQLGIDTELLPALRILTEESQLEALLHLLPTGQADALIELTGEESVDDIYSRIAGDFTPGSISEEDVAGALDTPAGRSGFSIVSSDAELQEMLAKPLAQWKHFLHPSQERFAFKEVFNGPARVTGGAGTGKTVVAMHRAAFLAAQLERSGGKPILFTTYTKNLAEAIEADLRDLGGADLLEKVEVTHVDRLANRVVREAEGDAGVARFEDVQRHWDDIVNELGLEYRAEFLNNEWEQVILAQGCRSRAEYFTVSRAGRGVRLDRRARADVWRAIEAFTQRLAENNQRTFLQLADAATGYLARREVRPYEHVIVDEAQDMHEAQWRMLRAAVAEGPNDMFIVGDSHQRIYDRRSSLSKVGINVRGRAHRLHINYRTTHEILRWSLKLLGGHSYDDLDEDPESNDFAGYHSFMHGPEPVLIDSQSRRAEIDALVAQVDQWINDGVHEDEIAVVTRIGSELEAIEHRLKAAGIQTCRLGASLPRQGGVRLANMHRVKGLEFRCVAISGVSDESVPLRAALTDKTADEVQHRLDLVREGCLLYVAATRAREQLWVGWSGRASRFLDTAHG